MAEEDTATEAGLPPGEPGEQLAVLLVDPDEACRDAVREFAARRRPVLTVRGVADIESALTVLRADPIACVVSEFELQDGDVDDLATRLSREGIDVPVVVFTDRGPAAVSGTAFHSGAADFVQKPADGDYGFLLDKVQGAVERDVAGTPGGRNRLGEAPDAAQLVALLDDGGEVTWQTGELPDVDAEDSIEGLVEALAEGDRFRSALGRAAAAGEADEWVWPRTDAGAVEHRSVPLPALEDVARLSVFRDVTEERRIREEHHTFQQLLDTARDGLYTLDSNGYYRYVNRSMAAQLGYEPAEMLGMHASEPLTAESYEEGQAHVRDLVADEERESEVLELTVRTNEGETMPVAIHFAPLYDDDGTYDGLVGVLRDISERKEREQRLRESERRYRALAENLPNGAVAMFDADIRYSLVEGELFERLDRDAEDFEDTPIADVHDESYVERHLAAFEGVFDGERSAFEFSHRGRIYRTHLVPLRNEAGAITSGLSLILDVTERREHERELERQNERLSEFASIVSHDLRTPLTTARGHLELAADECDPENLDTIEGALDRMESLIEDTLEMARGSQMVTEIEPVDVGPLLDRCWEGIPAEHARLELVDGFVVGADEDRLQQVFENLLRNAIQHGGDEVTIRVGSIDETGFYVSDDGAGLSESEREQVFDRGFSTAESGTGYGMAIVAEIAEAHGWEIAAAESEFGGARFEITGVDVR